MEHMVLAAMIVFFPISTAMAQSCESQAVSARGKPLYDAAKNSFVKKCKRDEPPDSRRAGMTF
jgi:hypothetical protein